MKNKLYVVVLVVILSALCACGKQDLVVETPQSVDVITDEGAAEQESAPAIDEYGEQNVAESISELSEDDFSIADLGDGTCEIISCHAEVSIIDVPDTICGCTVVGIGQNAFSNLSATQINLPDTVEYIDSMAFSICENLETVDLGTGLKSTGELVFNYCDKLKSISFPVGMTTMEGFLLGQCNSLEDVFIPESVIEIPNGIADIAFCPNIVIITPAGSVAESVAIENGLPVQNN